MCRDDKPIPVAHLIRAAELWLAQDASANDIARDLAIPADQVQRIIDVLDQIHAIVVRQIRDQLRDILDLPGGEDV